MNACLASRQPGRRGFTLVELLVVTSIISLLAASVLFAMYGVMDDAKEARTKAVVIKLNELLLTRWESYRTRPLPLRITSVPPSFTGVLPNQVPLEPGQQVRPRDLARARLFAIRDLMRMEMPDRRTDLTFPPSNIRVAVRNRNGQHVGNRTVTLSEPSLFRSYRRRAARALGVSTNDLSNTQIWTTRYENAECLYLIVSLMREGDQTGLDFFRESEIGDLDGDDMPELLDGWGNPIRFLRWAPGFKSELQMGDLEPEKDNNAGPYPDPFDPLKLDPRWRDGVPNNDPFALYPLVYSAGRDGFYDIAGDVAGSPLVYSQTTPPADPYFRPGGGADPIGMAKDIDGDGVFGYEDNITNHLLELY